MSASASLNWKEIDLILAELDLAGSLIQEVHQPRFDRIVLHLFREGASTMLLISLSARFPRMHRITEKLANPEKPLRFAAFLRAHIRGGRIERAEQVRATPGAEAGDRIVRIAIQHGGEIVILWVRLWGAAANALLTEESGTILDAFFRRPKKGEVAGKSYDPLAPRPATAAARAPAASSRASAAPRPAAPPRPPAAPREYAVRDLPGDGSFNERLEAYYRDVETRGDVEKAAAEADAELEMSENKLLANLEKLTARLSEYANLERFKELGDLVTSNLHTIGRGDRWVEVEDFFHDNARLRIELRPELTPAQNAEVYYDKHRKARLGLGKVEEEIAHLTKTLERIRRQRAAVAENPDPASLGRVAKSAARARNPLRDAGTPGLVFFSPPFRILVGRTASENDALLRTKVRGNDWWFHARDWPGAYVFVKTPQGKSLPLETMIDAATLAVHFSKGKTSGQGDVYYTRVKYLRRAKGAKKGTVLPTQEKNIHVKLDAERIERLKTGETT
jgi:predicted ribosome quality control (RQC) complex YloA/Tae2 family protein